MDRFTQFVEWFWKLEGCDKTPWVHNPGDPGGPTMWGIASKYNPELEDLIITRTLTKSKAFSHLRAEYYAPIHEVEEVPAAVAWMVFDSKCHGGSDLVIKILQRILNIMRFRGTRAVPGQFRLTEDGIWGPLTARWSRSMTESEVRTFLVTKEVMIDTDAQTLAKRTRQMARVRKADEIVDYYDGFSNRLATRINLAQTLT